MDQHFLQSEAWRRFEEGLGKTVFEESGAGWSFMAIREQTPFGKYLYLPYGPTFTDQQSFLEALNALRKLAVAQGAVFVRIEPTGGIDGASLSQLGFRRIKEVNPEHTWVLDLTQSPAEILSGMKQNNRNLYNNYSKKGLSVHNTTDPSKITYLTSLLADVSTHNRFSTHSEGYLRKQMTEAGALLYYVTINEPDQESSVIAAALVYDSGTTRYYAHAAADYEHRKLSAGTVLVAQMIMDAQAKGLTTFDFYGITTSDDSEHPWYGFTKFKRSFGGRLVTYCGTWDLPVKKAQYQVFTQVRAANRRVRALLSR